MKNVVLSSIIVGAVLMAAPMAARADQCQLIPNDQAVAGAQFLGAYGFGGHIVALCEPCGTGPERVDVTAVAIADSGFDDLWEISVNGVGVDLAYAYIGNETDGYFNLSKLVGCPSDGVTHILDGQMKPTEGTIEIESDDDKFDLPDQDASDSEGGCATGGGAGSSGLIFVGLALGLLAYRRRR